MPQHSPLEAEHRRLGATLVEFGGFLMPLQYGSIRAEHEAVRERAGLFDVSHMGELWVSGLGAFEFVQRLVTNDLTRLEPGQALYTVMCRPDGGIIDDLLVYRGIQERDGYLLVVNAARRDRDLAWLAQQPLVETVTIEDRSEATALLALQGPRALAILEPLVRVQEAPAGGAHLGDLDGYRAVTGAVAGVPALISRTGYTGEDGFELYCPHDRAGELWRRLIEVGAGEGLLPAGLAARDTLRLEAGLRLYGQDMDESTDPYAAGLGWTVKLAKGPFTGSEALARRRTLPRDRVLAGLRMGPRQIPRHGQLVLNQGKAVGAVTSGGFGFTVGGGVALAALAPAAAALGTGCSVEVRGTLAAASVVPLPFYRRPTR